MRKTLLTIGLILLSIAFVYGTADAVVGGVCSGCHTMHNSQNGNAVDATGPNNNLLKADCVGCHTSVSIAGDAVVNKTSPGTQAGGSFDYTAVATTSAKRHDVQDLSLTEGTITTTPGNTEDTTIVVAPNSLTCAGTLGCHGNHVDADGLTAIRGNHHGSLASMGYRFLYIGTTTSPTAVLGEGDTNYEVTVTNTDHNVYSADSTAGISMFCNQCHGAFHGTTNTETGGTSSPWKRHPTDYALFTGGAEWNSTSTNLNASDAPIALISIGTNTTASNYYQDGSIDMTNSAVMCLSCHRAHGTANDDILRWVYNSSANSGGTTKCLSCHYQQQ